MLIKFSEVCKKLGHNVPPFLQIDYLHVIQIHQILNSSRCSQHWYIWLKEEGDIHQQSLAKVFRNSAGSWKKI